MSNPTQLVANRFLGKLSFKLGDKDSAIKNLVLEEILKLDEDDKIRLIVAAHLSGDSEKAEKRIKKLSRGMEDIDNIITCKNAFKLIGVDTRYKHTGYNHYLADFFAKVALERDCQEIKECLPSDSKSIEMTDEEKRIFPNIMRLCLDE